MKVPSNNMNGYSTYEEEHYFNEAGPPHNGTTNGTTNGNGTTSAPPAEETDFSEYMWMENEEEFDKEVLQRLEEEELMEQCMLQHMLDNENQTPAANTNNWTRLCWTKLSQQYINNIHHLQHVKTTLIVSQMRRWRRAAL
ncbi:PREDICTED: uncharacterized protein LOC108569151 isoform X2 [Nicrophorus vespilloides]|uniref:Uncharacterized protein LOC108569151 isoform X2 n=1 Tax=Nicrophorus vespilloides TaxID=110193 RepID=A0ABM1NGY2_NICVS|nr:PREDICTED: uncharacterized protein LOC108569151 isoform X2 [Nicrophorus vespilloides]